jgi:hypothetical protein
MAEAHRWVFASGVENEGTDKVTAINEGDKLGTGHTSARVTSLPLVQVPSYLTYGLTRGAAIVSRRAQNSDPSLLSSSSP